MKVSLIVPAYNSRERLQYNLIALNCQDFPFTEFEVIVVDNGSKDNTSAMVSSFKANYPLHLIKLERNMSLAFARNRAIEKATGDILIFHDSDMLAPKDFVRKHVEAHSAPNIVVCGNSWRRVYTFYYSLFSGYLTDNLIKVLPKYNLSMQALHGKNKYPILGIEHIFMGDVFNYSFDLDIPFILSIKDVIGRYGNDLNGYPFPWRLFITNNCSVERKIVLDVGKMDENIVRFGFEDYDLGLRLYKHGCKYISRPGLISLHQEHIPNSTATDFWYNLYYVCKKYNSVYFADFQLALAATYSSVVLSQIDIIMNEIEAIKGLPEYNYLISVFLKLLEIIRDRHPKFIALGCIGMSMPFGNGTIAVDMDIEKIRVHINELRYKYKLYTFANTMSGLVKQVYNMNV